MMIIMKILDEKNFRDLLNNLKNNNRNKIKTGSQIGRTIFPPTKEKIRC